VNVKAIARRLPKLSESRSPPLLLFLTEQGFEEYAISCRNLSRIRHLLPPLCIRREDLYFPAQTQVAGVPKLSARPRLKPYAHAPHRSVTPSFYFISFIRWGRPKTRPFLNSGKQVTLQQLQPIAIPVHVPKETPQSPCETSRKTPRGCHNRVPSQPGSWTAPAQAESAPPAITVATSIPESSSSALLETIAPANDCSYWHERPNTPYRPPV
jgi:hypothetical protein